MSEISAVPAAPFRSVSESQTEILRAIMALHVPDGFEADVTYGKGGFWKEITPPPLRFDIAPQEHGVVAASSEMLPLETGSVSSLVYDPPFLTYVRGREGNGAMIMARQFSGFWTYEELSEHYQHTISEAARVLKTSGVLVIKCQDIVHNHRLEPTHARVMQWAEMEGFALLDLFVLIARHRLPAPNRRGVQRHARIFHSYFIVFRKR